VEAISDGEALQAVGLLPPGMPGFTPAPLGTGYDPAEARQLLAESSYAAHGLPPIVWTLPTSGGYASPAASLLVDMWREVLGVDVTLEGVDWSDYDRRIDRGDYGQILFEGWCADYPDPQNFLDVLFHSGSAQNHAGYSSGTFDRLVEDARTEPGAGRRLDLYRSAEQVLLKDAPAVFLDYSGPSYTVWKPRVHGYAPAPIGVPQHQWMWVDR
jgi:ABC-type transport system substrate-binding protein